MDKYKEHKYKEQLDDDIVLVVYVDGTIRAPKAKSWGYVRQLGQSLVSMADDAPIPFKEEVAQEDISPD